MWCIESNNFLGYVSIHESLEDNSEEEQWVKFNIDRKRLPYIDKYCFDGSQNYCSTGDSRTEYSF
jgi:hypothetical protein